MFFVPPVVFLRILISFDNLHPVCQQLSALGDTDNESVSLSLMLAGDGRDVTALGWDDGLLRSSRVWKIRSKKQVSYLSIQPSMWTRVESSRFYGTIIRSLTSRHRLYENVLVEPFFSENHKGHVPRGN